MKKRLSPKKPLLAALGLACLSVLFSMGYRGKYRPAGASVGFPEGARVFVMVLSGSFVVLYPLRMLGVHMGPWGGKEEEPIQPSETTRGK